MQEGSEFFFSFVYFMGMMPEHALLPSFFGTGITQDW